MRALPYFLFFFFKIMLVFAQDIHGEKSKNQIITHQKSDEIWQLIQLENTGSSNVASFKEPRFNLTLRQDGGFSLNMPDVFYAGHWVKSAETLLLYCNVPSVVFRRFSMNRVSESRLLLNKDNKTYVLVSKENPLFIKDKPKENPKFTQPNKGFLFTNLFRGLLGMFTLLSIAFLLSENKKKINWKSVSIGLLAQLSIAVCIRYFPAVQWLFEQIGYGFVSVLNYTRLGSSFLLGSLLDTETYGFIFVFQILPTIIFFSALMSILFYLGIIQRIVYVLAWVMTKTLRISGAESLAVAGNIFLGQTEAPIMIKAYLDKMNRSEIFLVMVGGMATLAGGILAVYIDMLGGGNDIQRIIFARDLLMASVMAAPGAVVMAKIMVPQTQTIKKNMELSKDKVGSNFLDALSMGTTEGLKLAANVGAMLLVFIALISMLNGILEAIGNSTSLNNMIAEYSHGQHLSLSLEYVLGKLFAPLAYAIGVCWEDTPLVGRLLGEKLIASEFIAYSNLAQLRLENMFLESKSVVISTFMLSGFANIASIGVQIGGISSLAPNQRSILSKYGFKAMIAGMLASLLSATLAGILMG